MGRSLAVIGSAGRGGDRRLVEPAIWSAMSERLVSAVAILRPAALVSGGAAFADHLAVKAFLVGLVDDLVLHSPARIGPDGFEGHPDARTANEHHARFGDALGFDPIEDILEAGRRGAVFEIHPGYAARNVHVARADAVIAFTAGGLGRETVGGSAREAGLKRGGTFRTWDMARTPHKVHVDLLEVARRVRSRVARV